MRLCNNFSEKMRTKACKCILTVTLILGGVLKSMLTLNEAIIDVKEG